MEEIEGQFEQKREMLKKHLENCGENERATRNHWIAFVEQLDERGFFAEGPEATRKPILDEELDTLRVINRLNLIETKLNSAESVNSIYEMQIKLDSALSDIRTMKRNVQLMLVLCGGLTFGYFLNGIF